MQFVQVIDYGSAPQVHVTGVANVTRISPGMVRMQYHQTRVIDGRMQNVVVLEVLWDLEQLLAAHECFKLAIPGLLKESAPLPSNEPSPLHH